MRSLADEEKCGYRKSRMGFLKCFSVLLLVFDLARPEDAKCGRPGRVAEAIYEPSGTLFKEGQIIRYKCKEKDRVIFDHSERKCQRNGLWSDEIPVCSKLANLQTINMMDPEITELKGNETVDKNLSTCSEDIQTTWNGILAVSTIISAIRLSLLSTSSSLDIDVHVVNEISETSNCRNMKEHTHTDSTIKSPRTVTIYCPDNTIGIYIYISLKSPSIRICEVSALLHPESSCLTPDIPLHGFGFPTRSSHDGGFSNYTIRCDTGYKLFGSVTVTCEDRNGTWSSRSTVCAAIFCNVPENFENGYIEKTPSKRIPYLGNITFVCNEGFKLYGSPTAQCVQFNEWNRPIPICQPSTTISSILGSTQLMIMHGEEFDNPVTQCGSVPPVANGKLHVNSTQVGSIAWLQCSDGYRPYSDINITCLSTGEWSSSLLHCKVIECEANPVVPHGRAILLDNSTFYGSHLQIKCNGNYDSGTPIIRHCTESGTWGDLSVCIDIICGSLANRSTQGRWMHVNGSDLVRFLKCPKDHYIIGSPAVVQCLSNGSWSYTSAECKSLDSYTESNWPRTPVLLAAIGVGAATALLIVGLCGILFIMTKRQGLQKNTTMFHLHDTSSDGNAVVASDVHGLRHQSAVENFENVELRPRAFFTNPIKPHPVLPNLPIDADPVYSFPFERIAETDNVLVNKKDDLCSNHIYAEPLNSRVDTSNPASISLSRKNNERSHISTLTPMYINTAPIRPHTLLPPINSSFGRDRPTSIPVELHCDKECVIYDSSSNSTLNSAQFSEERLLNAEEISDWRKAI